MPKWVLPAAQNHAPESLVELEQTGPANAPLAVYYLYSDGHRHVRCYGTRKAPAGVVYSVIASSLFCCCLQACSSSYCPMPLAVSSIMIIQSMIAYRSSKPL